MYNITNEEIESVLKSADILLKLKVNKLEDLIKNSGNLKSVCKKYSEYQKLKNGLEKFYEEYKELRQGLGIGELSVNFSETDRKVNSLMKEYKNLNKDLEFYYKIFNGSGAEGESD